MAVVLGIDTSNYTTSLSVVRNNIILSDIRQLLTVESGKRGLRQSEAVFKHMQNLPCLMERLKDEIKYLNIDAICVSTKPRPVNDSYMPVFKAGECFADFLGSFMNIPVYKISHQEGHIEAGLFSTGLPLKAKFITVHLSGGTCEILKVSPNESGFDIEIIGGTNDISAGQLIDRVGVFLGYDFPCGKVLDGLAINGDHRNCTIPYSCINSYMSFSGPETKAKKLIESGKEPKDVCAAVFENITLALKKTLSYCMEKYGIYDILFVGGVSSSIYIKNRLKTEYKDGRARLHFCDPIYSTDNSVGVALYCSNHLMEENYYES